MANLRCHGLTCGWISKWFTISQSKWFVCVLYMAPLILWLLVPQTHPPVDMYLNKTQRYQKQAHLG